MLCRTDAALKAAVIDTRSGTEPRTKDVHCSDAHFTSPPCDGVIRYAARVMPVTQVDSLEFTILVDNGKLRIPLRRSHANQGQS